MSSKYISRREFGSLAAACFLAGIAVPENQAYGLDLSGGTASELDDAEDVEMSAAENGQTVLWFSPHQDDELLTLGSGIIADVAAGYNVHVILCTDGRASGVRGQLGDQQYCSLCHHTHIYNISVSAFINARDSEFIQSCQSLGVPDSNIHIFGKGDGNNRVEDGSLDENRAHGIIAYYLAQYPNAYVRTISPLTGAIQHPDHTGLAKAAAAMHISHAINDLAFYIEPYFFSNYLATGAPSVKALACSNTSAFSNAANSYRYFNPSAGRYAVGYHSMQTEFDNLSTVQTDYYYPSRLNLLKRYGGNTRYDTMKQAVLDNWTSSTYAIVTSGENYPDALAASALAGCYNAPILLTSSNALSTQTAQCITALGVTKVFVVGGVNAITNTVYNSIKALCPTVARIAGDNRANTAKLVSQRVFNITHGNTCIVVSGSGFADALSISAMAYKKKIPIYLTSGTTLSTDTANAIKSCGYTKMIIVGGTDVVSSSVPSQCNISSVTRISGATRYETCVEAVKKSISSGLVLSGFSFCKGTDFPDALVAGPCAGKRNSVVFLTNESFHECSAVFNYLTSHKSQSGLGTGTSNCYALGDSGALSDKLAGAIVLAATPL